MRIIIFFILGAILAFYLSDIVIRAFRRYSTQTRHLHYSAFGFLIFLSGILTLIFGKGLVGDPSHIFLAVFLMGSGIGVIVHHLLSQSFIISEKIEKDFVQKHDNFIERCLEILPGAVTWIAITSPLWLSFTLPFAVAYLILLADIYWLFNAFKIAVLINLGYKKMEYAKKQDWLKRLKDDFAEDYQRYHHLIVIPTFKESLEILAPAFEAIATSNFPKEKIFVSIGFEAWDDPQRVSQVRKFLEDNSSKVGGLFITTHQLAKGEVKGPGSNRNWMIKNALKEFETRNIKPENVLATTLDADFCIHQEFLGGALHKYLSTPENTRDKRSFTGVFLYNNNYWQAPTPMRLMSSGTAFWQLGEMVGSDKYINFASLSMNLKSLLDIGLWMDDKVNDDSGFYWKAYYHYNGNYKVLPHFLPITADAVLDVTLFKTFQNQYLQLKRWAYGVEHIPFIVKEYFSNQKLDFWDKTDKLTFIFWSYFKWGTLVIFITFGGLFIPLVNPEYSQSVVAYNLSAISSWILTIAFVGLFSTIYIHEKVVPKRPANWGILKRGWSYVQWVLMPIVLVTIATLPAIDAQTSLMFGRYLEFRVTNKARIS